MADQRPVRAGDAGAAAALERGRHGGGAGHRGQFRRAAGPCAADLDDPPGHRSTSMRAATITERIFVVGGIAEVTPERCTVLADEAMAPDSLDRAALEAELQVDRRQSAEPARPGRPRRRHRPRPPRRRAARPRAPAGVARAKLQARSPRTIAHASRTSSASRWSHSPSSLRSYNDRSGVQAFARRTQRHGLVDARRYSLAPLRSGAARSRDRRASSRRRAWSSTTAPPTPIISAGSSPTIPRSRTARGNGARRKCSTARRWRAGRRWPIRVSISPPRSPGSRPASGSISTAPLAPRLARRRDGRALHRRDRHQLLLHRAARGGRRAGAAGNLPPHRRRRIAPLPALLQDTSCAYLARERLGRWARLRDRARPLAESEDDELAYAYYAANEQADAAL